MNSEMMKDKLIQRLFAENAKLKKELARERREREEDRRFAMNLIAAALEGKENHKIMYREFEEPRFELVENIDGNMIVVLKGV